MSPAARSLVWAVLLACLAYSCLGHKLSAVRLPPLETNWAGGIAADTLEELYTMFALLDHNKDGKVSVVEASAGLMSLGESPARPEAIHLSMPESAEEAQGFPLRVPAPSLDAPDFIDWVSAFARSSPLNVQDGIYLTFEDSVQAFRRKCRDLAPPAELLGDISPPLPGVGHSDRRADATHNTHNHNEPTDKWTCSNLGRHAAQSDYCGDDSGLVKGGWCLLSCGRCPSWPLKRVKVDKVAGDDVRGKNLRAGFGVPVLISSDWHIEPWYATQRNAAGSLNAGVTECKPEVSRFTSPNVTDMWQCRNDDGTDTTCFLTGGADPPIAVHATHIEAFLNTIPGHDGPSTILSAFAASQPRVARRAAGDGGASSGSGSAARALLFFIGDTQAHEYEKVNPEPAAITDLMNTTFQMVLSHFNPDDVYWTPGNNDGPHYAIFVDDGQNNSTIAWADALVGAGIVTDALTRSYDLGNGTMVGTVEFFRHTGYYLKAVDPSDTLGLAAAHAYVMILNNMLSYNNTRQRAAMEADLAWIVAQGGAVYILGHFPNFMTELAAELRANATIAPILRGFFAGHVHSAASTNALGFTQVPAITECALDTAFFIAQVSVDSMNIAVTMEHDMWTYCQPQDTVHIANVTGWRVRPREEAWLCRGYAPP